MSYMTLALAAAQLSTTKNDVRRMARAGVLRSVERDGHLLIDRASVIERYNATVRIYKDPRDYFGAATYEPFWYV